MKVMKNLTMIISASILAIALMTSSSCQGGESRGTDPVPPVVVQPEKPAEPPQPVQPAKPSIPGFDQINAAVIGPKCATCHSAQAGGGDGLFLVKYEEVFASREQMESEVRGGFMPPRRGKPLTAVEKKSLLAWLAAGAPRNPVVPTSESLQNMDVDQTLEFDPTFDTETTNGI